LKRKNCSWYPAVSEICIGMATSNCSRHSVLHRYADH